MAVKRTYKEANLCVNKRIVEQHEPVDGKTSRVLKSQSLITALTDQPTGWFTKRVLRKEENS